MIRDEFLRMLRCPVSHRPLRHAEKALLDRVNAAIDAKRLVNPLGETVDQPLDDGLVNEAGTLLYPVRDEIPCMLVDEAIALAQLEDEER
ncbi:MAG: Trm112 family protein [Pirellulaceae bacterium]